MARKGRWRKKARPNPTQAGGQKSLPIFLFSSPKLRQGLVATFCLPAPMIVLESSHTYTKREEDKETKHHREKADNDSQGNVDFGRSLSLPVKNRALILERLRGVGQGIFMQVDRTRHCVLPSVRGFRGQLRIALFSNRHLVALKMGSGVEHRQV